MKLFQSCKQRMNFKTFAQFSELCIKSLSSWKTSSITVCRCPQIVTGTERGFLSFYELQSTSSDEAICAENTLLLLYFPTSSYGDTRIRDACRYFVSYFGACTFLFYTIMAFLWKERKTRSLRTSLITLMFTWSRNRIRNPSDYTRHFQVTYRKTK